MATTSDSASKSKGKPSLTQDEVIQKFQTLRNEQRQLALKLSELEQDLHEHSLVLETLKTADPARRCYRLVSGVLCEMTVADVCPVVRNNSEQLTRLIAALKEQLVSKGRELVEHKERYNIRIRGAPDDRPPPGAEDEKQGAGAVGKEPSSVLVGGNSDAAIVN